jgi:thioredoxin reductase (NADPH)
MKPRVAIIGAGPAGMATVLQLARYSIPALWFGEDKSLLQNAWRVENYLGMSKACSGMELLQQFQQHLARYNISCNQQSVIKLDYLAKGNNFVIATKQENYTVDYVIVASGTKPKMHPLLEALPGELKPRIFYEVQPILNVKNKTIVIIGAGDAAFDFALNLAAQNKVFIVNRGNSIKALPFLIVEATKHINIKYYDNYVLDSALLEIDGHIGLPLRVNFKHDIAQEPLVLGADYLIAALGREPQKDFYTPGLLENEAELLYKGIFYLAGDVKNSIYRQTMIAAADGVKSAMQLIENVRSFRICK